MLAFTSQTAMRTALLGALLVFAAGCRSAAQTSTVQSDPVASVPPAPPATPAVVNRLPATAPSQRYCPVTGAELGSMGPPVSVNVDGRTVYVCCAGCVDKLKRDSQRYLQAGEPRLSDRMDEARYSARSAPSKCGEDCCE